MAFRSSRPSGINAQGKGDPTKVARSDVVGKSPQSTVGGKGEMRVAVGRGTNGLLAELGM